MPVGDDAPVSVSFKRAGKSRQAASESMVLEAAEDAGVAIFVRVPIGQLRTGQDPSDSETITMAVQDALTPADRSKQLLLACLARVIGDDEIDG